MGITCEGPSYIEADNQSVLANTTVFDSTLNNRSQIISYHMIREVVVRDEWRTTYFKYTKKETDLLTKQLPDCEKRKGLIMSRIHHIFSS